MKRELRQEYEKKKHIILQHLQDFKNLSEEDSFYEMCFCILTPQSKGRRADRVIQELKKRDFRNNPFNPSPFLEKNIRFHHTKSKRLLILQKDYNKIKKELDKISSPEEKRLFLIKNINGYGLKEASHFLRNTGHENLAILDRHILKNLYKNNVIKEIPKTLTPNLYFDIEKKFRDFSKKVNIPMDHLDLLFWSFETGEVFK